MDAVLLDGDTAARRHCRRRGPSMLLPLCIRLLEETTDQSLTTIVGGWELLLRQLWVYVDAGNTQGSSWLELSTVREATQHG